MTMKGASAVVSWRLLHKKGIKVSRRNNRLLVHTPECLDMLLFAFS